MLYTSSGMCRGLYTGVLNKRGLAGYCALSNSNHWLRSHLHLWHLCVQHLVIRSEKFPETVGFCYFSTGKKIKNKDPIIGFRNCTHCKTFQLLNFQRTHENFMSSWSAALFLGCTMCPLKLHLDVLIVIFLVLVLALIWLATHCNLNWFNWF